MLEARLAALRRFLADRNVAALMVTDPANMFYLSGFTGDSGALIVTHESTYMLVDPRYTSQARAECGRAEVIEYFAKPTVAAAAEFASGLGIAALGFESEHLSVSTYRKLRGLLDKKIRLRATKGVIERQRAVKDAHELALIRRAAEIADMAFASVVGRIEPGMSEKQVALMIDCALRECGADREAFETIAAAGPNSARPHASPTDAILASGQLLKMDFGARFKGYNSDITRTICLGKPTAKQAEIHAIVLEAQQLAIETIAPGVAGRDVDAIARDFIASKGYGENFGHGLGHALGIGVHDGPALSKTSVVVLEEGMVVTVEPGIYIEGWGGVRIEDDVLVTSVGADVLTKSPRGRDG